jgi:hypothetical protein
VVSVGEDFYAWSLEERLHFVVLADHGHVGIRALGLQFIIGLSVGHGPSCSWPSWRWGRPDAQVAVPSVINFHMDSGRRTMPSF